MILSNPFPHSVAWLALGVYLWAAWRGSAGARWPLRLLVGAWSLHAVALVMGADFGHEGEGPGVRFGFAPVLSFTLWLVLAVHAIESRLVPVPALRRVLALCGAAAVALAMVCPGEWRTHAASPWAPLHWLLGLTSYGLFATAVLHGLLLDAAEQRLRAAAGRSGATAFGMPLLQLERLTFRFVEAGFAVLTLTLVLGAFSGHWRWDHKTVLSLLGWGTFAALIVGRQWRGWRGRQATRWLYAGALLLLLAYVGSRFVMEVVLQRAIA
jgi:ABC-type uncharacterized transport system permease subunit